jgi:hypothetical protein
MDDSAMLIDFGANEFVSEISESENNGIHITISTVGSYESMLEWRSQYIEWLDHTRLSGSFRISLTQSSRTWYLHFWFSDVRDAVMFKLTWD